MPRLNCIPLQSRRNIDPIDKTTLTSQGIGKATLPHTYLKNSLGSA
jgi:hypothetical protein